MKLRAAWPEGRTPVLTYIFKIIIIITVIALAVENTLSFIKLDDEHKMRIHFKICKIMYLWIFKILKM